MNTNIEKGFDCTAIKAFYYLSKVLPISYILSPVSEFTRVNSMYSLAVASAFVELQFYTDQ